MILLVFTDASKDARIALLPEHIVSVHERDTGCVIVYRLSPGVGDVASFRVKEPFDRVVVDLRTATEE